MSATVLVPFQWNQKLKYALYSSPWELEKATTQGDIVWMLSLGTWSLGTGMVCVPRQNAGDLMEPIKELLNPSSFPALPSPAPGSHCQVPVTVLPHQPWPPAPGDRVSGVRPCPVLGWLFHHACCHQGRAGERHERAVQTFQTNQKLLPYNAQKESGAFRAEWVTIFTRYWVNISEQFIFRSVPSAFHNCRSYIMLCTIRM